MYRHAFLITMYPSWGDFGGPQSQNYGGSGPRKQPGSGQSAGFGGFEPPSTGSMFSSLQEQHRQQMQQLQMLHQKQLQSVLHHGNNANSYGAGHSVGYSGTSWHPQGVGHSDSGFGAQSYSQQVETPRQPTRDPAAPQQVHTQPPPPPPQANEPQPGPPPPEPPSVKPPDNSGAPKKHKKKQSSTTEDNKSLPLQVMSRYVSVFVVANEIKKIYKYIKNAVLFFFFFFYSCSILSLSQFPRHFLMSQVMANHH